MHDDPIDAEIIEVQVVACPQCGQRNRLRPERKKVGYRCGSCQAELPNPFIVERGFPGAPSIAERLTRLPKFAWAALALVLIAGSAFTAWMYSNRDNDTPQDSLNVIREVDLHSKSSTPSNAAFQPGPEATTSPRALANGARVSVLMNFGDGVLEFGNGTKLDAVVKMVDERAGRTVIAFYACAGQEVRIDRIPDGVFRVVVASGVDWDSAARRFTRSQSFSRFDTELKFITSMQPNNRGMFTKETSTFALAIGKSAPGGPKISTVSEEEFRKY